MQGMYRESPGRPSPSGPRYGHVLRRSCSRAPDVTPCRRAARARGARVLGLIHGLGLRGVEVKALWLGVVDVRPAVGELDGGCVGQLLIDRVVAAHEIPLLLAAELRTSSSATRSSGYYVRRYREIYEELPYSTTIEFADRGPSIYYAEPEGFDLITTDPQAVDEPDDSSCGAQARALERLCLSRCPGLHALYASTQQHCVRPCAAWVRPRVWHGACVPAGLPARELHAFGMHSVLNPRDALHDA
jgi:hypothetical protein